MTDIFISYAHKDKDRVKTIQEWFEGKGYSVWFDEKNLRPMERFTQEIMDGILSCSIFLLVYSRAYSDSEYCGQEMTFAKNNGKTVTCMVIDEEYPWSGREVSFYFAGLTIPG